MKVISERASLNPRRLIGVHKFQKQEYIDGGGSLMLLLGEGGENAFNTNLNFFLEQYGMTINSGKLISQS